MVWVKLIFVFIFSLIFLGIGSDAVGAYKVYDSMGRGMEQSLDAGIIASEDSESYTGGQVQLREDVLKAATVEQLKKNLKLDNNLDGSFIKNGQFTLIIHYDENKDPVIEMTFSVQFSLSFKDISYPIQVSKKVPYYTDYK